MPRGPEQKVGEERDKPRINEQDLFTNPPLISRYPELEKPAREIRAAFKEKGANLDDLLDLMAARMLGKAPTKGTELPKICQNVCIVWAVLAAEAADIKEPRLGCMWCAHCVTTCTACVMWD